MSKLNTIRDSILDSLRSQFRSRCLDITIANVERAPSHVAMYDNAIPAELEAFLRDCANNAAQGLLVDEDVPHCPNCTHACMHCALDAALAHDVKIEHCSMCGVPAHPSETNDDGVCGACMKRVGESLEEALNTKHECFACHTPTQVDDIVHVAGVELCKSCASLRERDLER